MDAILLKMYLQKRTNDLDNPANKKLHYISKNWERVFHFQYKVVIGQCDPLVCFPYEMVFLKRSWPKEKVLSRPRALGSN